MKAIYLFIFKPFYDMENSKDAKMENSDLRGTK
jgi:hypothetical protein